MIRARLLTLLFTSLFALPLFAQEPATTFGFDQSASSSVVQTPEQIRRVPPPEKTASAEDLEKQADELRAQKNYADAVDYYRAAIKKHETPVLENKAGIAELQLLHVDEARQRFERAVKLDRTYSDAHNNLGVVYYVKRNYGKAIKEYNKAIHDRPDSASFHSNLGSALFARKDYEKASAEYMTAMQIDPEVFTRQSTTGIQAKLGSPEDRARFHFTIAKVFATRGDTDNCLLYLRKAMEDGFPSIQEVYKESEFAGIRKDPRFVTLMASQPESVK